MPKLKTHKGVAKVLKQRKGGTIAIGHPGSRHNTGKKSMDINRSKRKKAELSSADRKRLKSLLKH